MNENERRLAHEQWRANEKRLYEQRLAYYGAQHLPPAAPAQAQPAIGPQIVATARTGLPVWLHLLYAFVLGPVTCGAGWVVWLAHWLLVQRRTTITTNTFTDGAVE